MDETDQVHPFASLGFVYFGNASDFQEDDVDDYDESTKEVDYFVQNLLEIAYDVEPPAMTVMTCTLNTTFHVVHRPSAAFPKEVEILCTPPAGYVLHSEAIPTWLFRDNASDTAPFQTILDKDGRPVRMESSFNEDSKKAAHWFTRVYDNKTFGLVIRDPQFQDEGLYRVQTTLAKAETSDQKGPDQTFAPMKLEAKPSIDPYFELSYAVDVGNPIDLSCTAWSEGVFSPTVITWWKNGEVFVPDGDRVRFGSATYQNGSNTLSFTTTQYDDRAEYNCTAANDAGTSSTKTTLRCRTRIGLSDRWWPCLSACY